MHSGSAILGLVLLAFGAGCSVHPCASGAAPLLEARSASNGGAVEVRIYPGGCMVRQVRLFGGTGTDFTASTLLTSAETRAIDDAVEASAFFDLPPSIDSRQVRMGGEYRSLTVRGPRGEHSVTAHFPEYSSQPPEAARFLALWAHLFELIASYR